MDHEEAAQLEKIRSSQEKLSEKEKVPVPVSRARPTGDEESDEETACWLDRLEKRTVWHQRACAEEGYPYTHTWDEDEDRFYDPDDFRARDDLDC